MSEDTRPTSVSDEIFEDLLGQILREELLAGARLPSERRLAEKYGTNRNTLREAIHRLEHAHLVRVRHGQGITVCDFRRSGTVELLGPFLRYASDPVERVTVIIDLLRARSQILEMSIELAATRATESDVQRISSFAAKQLANFAAGDRTSLVETDIEMISAIVDAAHSLTARWLANTLMEVYRGLISQTSPLWVFDESFPEFIETLSTGIAEGKPARAVEATQAYLGRIDKTLRALLELVLQHPPVEKPDCS